MRWNYVVGYSEVCLAKKFGNHLFDVGIKLTIKRHFIMHHAYPYRYGDFVFHISGQSRLSFPS